ncbi:MAG: iron ABC transporter permease [Candidatus Thermoplasmatota archaeon]|nr:iron ABC transporter permease [Candidatus Thermoplasmatota archaeon]
MAFAGLTLVTAVISLSLGSVSIPYKDIVKILLSRIPLIGEFFPEHTGPESIIILKIRLPRILLGLIAGISLSVSGSSMQGVFKNPMASPFILGVSAGGAFGAAVGIFFDLPWYLLPLIAFIFAMVTMLTVFFLGRVRGRTDISTLLLAGLAMNFLMTALTSLILFYSDPAERMSIVAWTWGSLSGTVWNEIWISLPVMVLGSGAVYAYSRDLNVIQTGETSAKQLGIEVEKTKIIQLITSSLLAAVVISFTGVIGFVGLIIPHASRLLVGPDHRKLIPISALLGGTFLMVCDAASRMSGEIWVGVITGLFGAPFFIYLLIRNRGETGW